MIWKESSNLKDHALCGGSNYSWRNKTVDELIQFKINSYAVKIGTLLHEYAKDNIEKQYEMSSDDACGVFWYLTVKHDIPKIAIDMERIFPTLMNYVNDAIKFKMRIEQKLSYSDDFSGTADAISYEKNELMIFDLKTGVTQASFLQLENYAAFFCLEYKVAPKDIKKIEYRIYQNGGMSFTNPEPKSLTPIIAHIVETDKAFKKLFKE